MLCHNQQHSPDAASHLALNVYIRHDTEFLFDFGGELATMTVN